jgi:HNH endonuclease
MRLRKVCIVTGCSLNSHSKGMCKRHYDRFIRYGDTTVRNKKPNGSGATSEANGKGYVRLSQTLFYGTRYEHIHLAEKALGKPLPKGAIVHHMNGDKQDNFTPFNLVICPDQTYHMLLEKRTREYNQRKSGDKL